MKTKSVLAALLLLVAGLQTAWGQGFRVYKSDGTIMQFSLRTDSIVFYDGIGSDVDFGPFTPVNQMIAGTWYKTKSESITFNEDGTTDYISGGTYQFLPYQGEVLVYDSSNQLKQIIRVHNISTDELVVSTFGSTTFSVWSATQPPQLVTGITLSETELTMNAGDVKTLTWTVAPEDAENKTVTWSSSDEAVASVTPAGNKVYVEAVTNGTFVITCAATDGSGVKAECQVMVGEPAVEDEQTFTVGGVTFKMKKVDGGTFTMGATAEQSNGYEPNSDEKPTHLVMLSDYWMGETEVTQALWYAVMGAKPTSRDSWSTDYGLGDNYPAYYVSLDDCQEFITKLNQMTGKTFRLPTEAEWEFAARGGNKSQGYIFSGSNTIDDVAWYTENSSSTTHPVATKAPNELGIYDMSGNVYEWCQDWYGDYGSGSQTNPTGPTTGSYRVFRGGGWYAYATYCRVANRDYTDPTYAYNDLGLRLAL